MRHSFFYVFLLSLALALCGPSFIDHEVDAQSKRSKRSQKSKKSKKSQKSQRSKKSKSSPSKSSPGKKNQKLKVFDFTGLDVAGQLRAPQLLYFLDRAAEELQRAALERRSFVPAMVRSLDEESL